ncbi:hypothetical protein [Exiguobacterium sp. AT1b]|nr:hypothetical protein [Exiguobacterium sp. AT1b]
MDFFFYIMIMVIVVSLVGANTIIKTREARSSWILIKAVAL